MNQYGGGAIILGLDRSEQSSAVDILATVKWLQGHRLVSAGRGPGRLTQVRDLPTGTKAEKLAVRRRTLTGDEGAWTPPALSPRRSP
jgi:hypothetical protein